MNLRLKFASRSLTYSCIRGSLLEHNLVEALEVLDIRVLKAALLALSSVLILVDHCRNEQGQRIQERQVIREVSECQ